MIQLSRAHPEAGAALIKIAVIANDSPVPLTTTKRTIPIPYSWTTPFTVIEIGIPGFSVR